MQHISTCFALLECLGRFSFFGKFSELGRSGIPSPVLSVHCSICSFLTRIMLQTFQDPSFKFTANLAVQSTKLGNGGMVGILGCVPPSLSDRPGQDGQQHQHSLHPTEITPCPRCPNQCTPHQLNTPSPPSWTTFSYPNR